MNYERFDYKKFAKNLVKALERKSSRLVVMRDEEDYYITDTFIAVKMNRDLYYHVRKAFAKYSIIPEIEKGDCVQFINKKPSYWKGYDGFADTFKRVLEKEDVIPANFTKFVFEINTKVCKACNLVYSDQAVIALDVKYGNLIKDFVVIEADKRAVYATEGDIVVVISPFYLGPEYEDELREEMGQIIKILGK